MDWLLIGIMLVAVWALGVLLVVLLLCGGRDED